MFPWACGTRIGYLINIIIILYAVVCMLQAILYPYNIHILPRGVTLAQRFLNIVLNVV
jgi:hypothetical protein